jgi:hypothetical protein
MSVGSAGRTRSVPEVGERRTFSGPLLVILGIAVVASAAALAAKAELGTAIPLIALASGAITLAVVLSFIGRVRWAPPAPPVTYLDPGVAVHEALVRKGAFGRQLVIAHLHALDRGPKGGRLAITREEEVRVLDLSASAFLDWTETKLAILEADS